MLQPCGRNSSVVIHECEDIARSLSDSRVAGVGMALLRLKQVTEATRVLADEVRDNLTSLIARVVINYNALPLRRLRNQLASEAVERFGQVPAAVLRAQDNCDLHWSP